MMIVRPERVWSGEGDFSTDKVAWSNEAGDTVSEGGAESTSFSHRLGDVASATSEDVSGCPAVVDDISVGENEASVGIGPGWRAKCFQFAVPVSVVPKREMTA